MANGDGCSKCAGTGRIPAFTHVQGGVCFVCGGSGVAVRTRAVSVPSRRMGRLSGLSEASLRRITIALDVEYERLGAFGPMKRAVLDFDRGSLEEAAMWIALGVNETA